MNRSINEDFDYRTELKSCFDVPFEAVQDLIFNQDRFAGIYHKETILDPEYEFDDEIKEQVKDSISSDSVWFELENGHVYEIGNDNDLINYYENNREHNWTSVDDIKDDILDDYIDYVQSHMHDDLFGCDITELNNDEIKEHLEQCNLTIDNCTVIGDMYDLNDIDCCCSWFVVDCGNNDIYIYQDWDQVWENIIYDLFPSEWLKEFVQK